MQEERTSMHCWDRDEQEGRARAKEKNLVSHAGRGEKATVMRLLKQASHIWRDRQFSG